MSGGLTNSGTFSNAAQLSGGVVNSGTLMNGGSIVGALSNSGILINGGSVVGSVVNTGALANNGSIFGALDNGGTLSGNGRVGALNVRAGAVVSPGNSIGTTNVSGNATSSPARRCWWSWAHRASPTVWWSRNPDCRRRGDDACTRRRLLAAARGHLFGDQRRVHRLQFHRFQPCLWQRGSLYPFLGGSLNGGTLTMTRSAVPYAAYAAPPMRRRWRSPPTLCRNRPA